MSDGPGDGIFGRHCRRRKEKNDRYYFCRPFPLSSHAHDRHQSPGHQVPFPYIFKNRGRQKPMPARPHYHDGISSSLSHGHRSSRQALAANRRIAGRACLALVYICASRLGVACQSLRLARRAASRPFSRVAGHDFMLTATLAARLIGARCPQDMLQHVAFLMTPLAADFCHFSFSMRAYRRCQLTFYARQDHGIDFIKAYEPHCISFIYISADAFRSLVCYQVTSFSHDYFYTF